jgi:hypothetical protein
MLGEVDIAAGACAPSSVHFLHTVTPRKVQMMQMKVPQLEQG